MAIPNSPPAQHSYLQNWVFNNHVHQMLHPELQKYWKTSRFISISWLQSHSNQNFLKSLAILLYQTRLANSTESQTFTERFETSLASWYLRFLQPNSEHYGNISCTHPFIQNPFQCKNTASPILWCHNILPIFLEQRNYWQISGCMFWGILKLFLEPF